MVPSSEQLALHLESRRALVESSLRRLVQPTEECPPTLIEAMRYSLLAPGKRLRPLLVLLAVEACGGRWEDGVPAGCAVEMVHTYSLIHDDLPAMDDDDLRRGLPTCHKQFGEALAILAGDGLLTRAFEVLADAYPPRTAAALCGALARGAGAAGMVGGQVEDLAWERNQGRPGDPGQSLQVLENIHARKTGALFRSCLQLGIIVAQGERPGGADRRLSEALDGFGRCFGQAFQITDDLLDVEGNADQTGKRVQKDAARGKLTYPGLLGVAESRHRAERLGTEARSHLAAFDGSGEYLAALFDMILQRDR